MPQEFQDMGGAATMNPGALQRWLTSRFMSRLVAPERRERQRARAERARVKEGRAHVIEYFHQVGDGYSHLTAQLLGRIKQRYHIELRCHLVSGPSGNNLPEPELLPRLAHRDAALIAPEYGLSFAAADTLPSESAVRQATALLAAQDSDGFAQLAPRIDSAAWLDDQAALAALASEHGQATDQQATESLQAGDARLRALGHYSGAMFYYEGEWYWGVDRLYHLEKRLGELGADRETGAPPLAARPSIEAGPLQDNGSLTLEVFPSLRSPYTAISFDRTVELARHTGVTLSVRPVLPMVMRGAPVTRIKGVYIFTDTAREAWEADVAFGKFYDPIGEPVRRAYSLYPWACANGRGNEFLSAFLRAAFAEGINTNAQRGLAHVVKAAGLDWNAAQAELGDPAWQELEEGNRNAMYSSGLWGVPSFRLLDSDKQELLAVWGQDRLWLVSREIQRQLKRVSA